jgi:hypothetical protein
MLETEFHLEIPKGMLVQRTARVKLPTDVICTSLGVRSSIVGQKSDTRYQQNTFGYSLGQTE